jgi:hypothetical protein
MKNSGDPTKPGSQEIKADIDRTRARMDSTINELEYRLNPRRIWNQLVSKKQIDPQMVMQAALVVGGMLVTTFVFRALRKHPLSALAGAGVTWLLMERSTSPKRPEPVIIPDAAVVSSETKPASPPVM